MQLRKLSLLKFRNYEQEIAYFSSDLNCIKGVNGSGKSNLLEAIHLLSTGKSFRTHRLPELIRHESKEFTLEAEFFKDGVTNTLKIIFSRDGSRKILHNQTSHASFLPLFGILPSIFLSPEDISIINGSPAERRRFLDLHCAQIDPLYIHHLGRYQRALKQRNILLKAGEEKGLFPWEQLMAISASYLIEKRIETLHALEAPSKRLVFELSKQKEPFSLSYQSSLSLPSNFKDPSFYAKQWEQARKKELYMGSTLIGPHRDDVLFSIDGKEVKTYCSEGQKRCCLAALRLSEWERLSSLLDSPPIFGIDDFGIHLDEVRSSILKDQLKKMGQVFLTAPSFPFEEGAHFLHAENGSLTKNKEITR
jgi:DNA replication and repair protein RecF